ncbi:hypothetical protein [Winogradskyella aurantiaca]|uniref:hypothetical protein n=1 Tax=Winogradskyella aurantiaca TaxID=2219558 RepID=UPI000E1CED91|nr:hypothetical protein [Winogradskyella aurantiaca]
MKFLQFFQYVYLIFVVLFSYDAIEKWGAERNRAYMSLFFAALSLFMFFFRKRFRKKFQDRN